MRVLLTESASLTCRETLTVLGRAGLSADVVSSGALTIGQFSRWRRRSLRLPEPAADPAAYLRRLGQVSHRYDAVLPTHEQAWLIAAGRHLLPNEFPTAVADIASFARVQSKLEFAKLLDELHLPQPRWWLPGHWPVDAPPVVWVKAAFSTAGHGVRRAEGAIQAQKMAQALARGDMPVMFQAGASGEYGQVQALFDHGRMFAAHTCVRSGTGVGGSAAARLSVDHVEAREAARTIGAELDWHGGLTVDYFHRNGRPQIIECNPRTVEPGNAAASGVDLPGLTIALIRGQSLPPRCLTGVTGVRTHSALALALGAAVSMPRRAVVRALASGGGPTARAEVLTPIREDPASLVPLGVTVARILAKPVSAQRIAAGAVEKYAITPDIVDRVRRTG